MGFRGYNTAAACFILLHIISFTHASSPRHYNLPAPPEAFPLKCPKDTLKFGVCGSWLGLVTEVIGTKPSEECCTLVKGLADLEAALCLCTAIKADVLEIVKLKVPIAITLIVDACGKKVPQGFVCE